MFRLIKSDWQTFKQLAILAIPMVVSQGAFAIMIFTDRYFMSLISPTHMAASLGGGVAFYFCLSLFTGLLAYANALAAQYYGAGQRFKCSRVVTQSFILCVMSLPVLAIVGYLVAQLFEVMDHDPQQVILEKRYFAILMWGCFFTLAKTAMASYFSGIARTGVVMIADTLGVVLNIPLSYLLIFGKGGLPEMGIDGAAIGTVISTGFSLAIFLYFYSERKHRHLFDVAKSFVIDVPMIKRYLKLGLPSGLEMFLNVSAFNLFLLMFQSYGVPQGASAAIVFNWDILSFVPMTGLNIALISLSGQLVGAANLDRLNRAISAGLFIGIGYSAVLGILYMTFRVELVELFITPGVDYQEIRTLATFMMVGLASYVVADALILVAGGVLRGAGDTQWLLYSSVTLHWLMVVAQFVVIKILHLSAETSWVIFVLMIISIAAIYLLRLFGEKWRQPEVLEKVLAEH